MNLAFCFSFNCIAYSEGLLLCDNTDLSPGGDFLLSHAHLFAGFPHNTIPYCLHFLHFGPVYLDILSFN